MRYKKFYHTKIGPVAIGKIQEVRVIGGKSEVDLRIQKTVAKQGVRIYPSAIRLAKAQVNKSIRNGMIKNRRERILSGSALILSAVNEAKSEGQKVVTTAHIKKGWSSLRQCPGNLPPHMCMRRSVIESEQKLRVSLPGLTEILDFTDNIGEE